MRQPKGVATKSVVQRPVGEALPGSAPGSTRLRVAAEEFGESPAGGRRDPFPVDVSELGGEAVGQCLVTADTQVFDAVGRAPAAGRGLKGKGSSSA
ncbi:hypothetical protein GCM10010271_72700 [Streptomyces kurssanovii]|nr:hypothetical protein GCM10010271_72700 [Streptomyces kurssanovii]